MRITPTSPLKAVARRAAARPLLERFHPLVACDRRGVYLGRRARRAAARRAGPRRLALSARGSRAHPLHELGRDVLHPVVRARVDRDLLEDVLVGEPVERRAAAGPTAPQENPSGAILPRSADDHLRTGAAADAQVVVAVDPGPAASADAVPREAAERAGECAVRGPSVATPRRRRTRWSARRRSRRRRRARSPRRSSVRLPGRQRPRHVPADGSACGAAADELDGRASPARPPRPDPAGQPDAAHVRLALPAAHPQPRGDLRDVHRRPCRRRTGSGRVARPSPAGRDEVGSRRPRRDRPVGDVAVAEAQRLLALRDDDLDADAAGHACGAAPEHVGAPPGDGERRDEGERRSCPSGCRRPSRRRRGRQRLGRRAAVRVARVDAHRGRRRQRADPAGDRVEAVVVSVPRSLTGPASL